MHTDPNVAWLPAEAGDVSELENSLVSALEHAVACDEIGAVWDSLTVDGTPLIHPAHGAATFLFQVPDDCCDVVNVHLSVNRLTDKNNWECGLMRRVVDTSFWVRTLELPPTYRGSYGFTPLTAKEQTTARQARPAHASCCTLLDPNACEHLIQDCGRGASIVAGSAAPSQPEWPARPGPSALNGIQGTLLTDTLIDPAGVPLRVYLYLPDGHDDAALLTVFDGDIWFPRLQLPAALERAAVPPLAVFGVCSGTTPQRNDRLGGNHSFLDFISVVGTTWAVEMARTHGVTVDLGRGNILAGQSLGGLSGLYMARAFPQRYSAVIAQSPSMWWTPDGSARPRDLGTRCNDWITAQFWAPPPREVPLPAIRLDVGARENVSVPRLHVLEQTLVSAGWPVHLRVYDGGHDYAWWRGALFDHLRALLACKADAFV